MKHCKYCRATEFLTIDHKVAQINGGSDDIKNLQCLCKRCNSMKSKFDDKKVRSLFRWFLQIQESRIEHDKKPYELF